MYILFVSVFHKEIVVVVPPLSHAWLFGTPWTEACKVSLSFPFSQNLLRFMPIELVMLPSRLIFCCPLLLLPSIFRKEAFFMRKDPDTGKDWKQKKAYFIYKSIYLEFNTVLILSSHWTLAGVTGQLCAVVRGAPPSESRLIGFSHQWPWIHCMTEPSNLLTSQHFHFSIYRMIQFH